MTGVSVFYDRGVVYDRGVFYDRGRGCNHAGSTRPLLHRYPSLFLKLFEPPTSLSLTYPRPLAYGFHGGPHHDRIFLHTPIQNSSDSSTLNRQTRLKNRVYPLMSVHGSLSLCNFRHSSPEDIRAKFPTPDLVLRDQFNVGTPLCWHPANLPLGHRHGRNLE